MDHFCCFKTDYRIEPDANPIAKIPAVWEIAPENPSNIDQSSATLSQGMAAFF